MAVEGRYEILRKEGGTKGRRTALSLSSKLRPVSRRSGRRNAQPSWAGRSGGENGSCGLTLRRRGGLREEPEVSNLRIEEKRL